ncbi:MAG TPA: HAMP domain-containing sensor histidine kinase, partial [Acidimicrobiales bacterium]|nr:HAMP domain-containing sensor histidine kinase [Acidimicrobiales bacterium]
DLLWLARLDSTPPRRLDEPVDLAIVVEGCVDRFAPMAAKRDVTLRREREADGTSWLSASADELDRLVGVLVDNACRYTPEGGTVVVTVEHRGGRLHLVVEDSGPGIPAAQRPLLFDRFHRASDEPGGTGLGLAIADSVVRGTGGRWHVGNSSLGGARMEVSWHRAGREKPPVQGLHGSVRSPA